jgi:hypothetical protein
VHYLRTSAPLGPESLAGYGSRLRVNRSNPYLKPGGFNNLASGLESFETRQCASGISASFPPKATTIANTAFSNWARYPVNSDELGDFYDRLRQFTFNDQTSSDSIAFPPCRQQGDYTSIGGAFTESTEYLHVRELAGP